MRIQRRKIQFEHIQRPPSASFFWNSFRAARGFPFNWHYHPEIELTLIIKGNGLRFVGDSIERFQAGDLCLLGSNLPHTWLSDGETGDAESMIFQFLPDFWGAAFTTLPEMRAVADLLTRSDRGLFFASPVRQRIEPMLRRLLGPGAARTGGTSIGATPTGATPTDALLVLLELLHELSIAPEVRPLCRTALNVTVDEQGGRRLKTVLDRVHHDIIDLPSQAELAETIGLSPQAFSRFFRQRVGKTFVSYVNEWRVGLACRSLIETDEQITAVAVDSGFDNLSHFNRQFRRITGLTPRDYRRRIAAKP